MLVNLISRLQAKSSRLLLGGPRPRARSSRRHPRDSSVAMGGFRVSPLNPPQLAQPLIFPHQQRPVRPGRMMSACYCACPNSGIVGSQSIILCPIGSWVRSVPGP